MKAAKIIVGILGVFVTLPIAIYLQYKILTLVSASDLMWFLFWVNVPVLFLISIISKVVESAND